MALGLLSLISTRAPALDPATGASSIGEWEATWTKVLTRHVDDSGRIDFDSLRRNHTDLDLIVAFAAAVDPITQPRQFPDECSRLAFYINAYNALAMYGIVQAGVPESLGGLRKFTFFYLRTFAVGGKSFSLSKFENDVIRPSATSEFTSPSIAWSSAARDFRVSRSARPPSTGSLIRPHAPSSGILETSGSSTPNARSGCRPFSISTPRIFSRTPRV